MPRQWQPVVAEFSRVQKLVHLAMRQDPVDVSAVSAQIFREKRTAYEDGLTIQAAEAGCPGRRGMADNAVLSEMKAEADTEAAGIVNTYNYDLAHAVRHIREDTPTANRNVYAKRLLEWDSTRSDWKSKQIMLWNTMSWRDRATEDFVAHNPQLNVNYAILQPRTAAVCDVCKFWIREGKVPIEQANKVKWPAHLNCPHYWEMHYEKRKVDCSEMWVGVPIQDQLEV